MNATAPAAELVRVEGAPPVVIRPAGPSDMPALMRFWAGPGTRSVCFEPGARQPAMPGPMAATLMATEAAGEVVGLGWVHTQDGQHGHFSVLVRGTYAHHELVPRLVRLLAEEARGLGLNRLETAVQRDTSDPFNMFEAAGLAMTSSLGFGGGAEVVLDLH